MLGRNEKRALTDFRPKWNLSLRVSAALFAVSAVLLLVRGLNLGIEFEGGGIWEVPVSEEVSVSDARDSVDGIVDDARVQTVIGPEEETLIRVQSATSSEEVRQEMVSALSELGEVTPDEVLVSTVGPTWGDQITSKALQALVAFFILVALYLAWRLQWQMAVGGLIAVAHDLVITAGIFSLFGFEVSPATVIALLTILGYSLYDTVVVYDKVLDNQRNPAVNYKTPVAIINQSMNEVLARSINTTVTTVLPVLSMLVVGVFLLGGSALLDFALALFIGLLLGTYSSIFVAAPVLGMMLERELDPSDRIMFTEDDLESGEPAADAKPKQDAKAKRSTSSKRKAKGLDGKSDDIVESGAAKGDKPRKDKTSSSAKRKAGAGTKTASKTPGRGGTGVTPRPRKKRRR